MARPAKTLSDTRSKMEALAVFVRHMTPDEIWAFLDALLPNLPDEEKEDLYGMIVTTQRLNEFSEAIPAEDVFAELERDEGISG